MLAGLDATARHALTAMAVCGAMGGLLAVAVSEPSVAGARSSCGRISLSVGEERYRYQVLVSKGVVRCSTARATLRAFLKGKNVRGRGWDCRNGGRGVR